MYRIFSQRVFKFLALFMVVNFISQILYPLSSYALTSGPSQPEVQSFEPVGTTEMVDLFSGDFTYNIPLFELPGPNGGYPFNLHYNSGVTMDQEASWTGLGWNLNPGSINRQMRGFPDDFKKDPIEREQDILDNTTFGGHLGGSLELFGGNASKGKNSVSVSLGIGVYYNNYKGVGYSIDPGINFHSAGKSNLNAGVGLNLSLDSQEGVGVNPSLSLSSKGENNTTSFSLGAGYNSRRGLTGVSMGVSATSNKKLNRQNVETKDKDGNSIKGRSVGGTSTLSLAGSAYSPQVGMPMQGRNISLAFRIGGEVLGTYGHLYVDGYFNTQYLKDKKSKADAYGYMYLQNATDKDLMDFNREKDGMVRENSPNLAIPSMSYDIYSVTGQGIAGMYRPYRNDVGTLWDQSESSLTAGGAGGFELGLGTGAHIGVDLSINYSKSTSGKWDDGNSVDYKFTAQNNNDLYEPYYFKTYGEHTSDATNELTYIGDSLPVRIAIGKDVAYNSLEKKNGGSIAVKNTNSTETREARNLTVQPITNDDLLDNTGNEILKEFKVDYFNSPSASNYVSSTKSSLARSNRKGHHTAGITALNPDGTRYVYGIPAYNTKQVECQYSVGAQSNTCASTLPITVKNNKPDYQIKNTEQYYNKTTVPEYAHSYLLTAILGTDYIDADDIAGPSEGDLGYWVKFNYVKVSTQYKWKVPYNGANYMKGYINNTAIVDDKAAYTYGEKEVWHLATVETKSHVAAFNLSQRKDGRGVNTEFQNSTDVTLGDYSYKLDKISLYARSEYYKAGGGKSIKNIYFDYTYDLCGKVHNNDGAQQLNSKGVNINAKKGKLTLKKVWFTDENNTRGALSPYIFNYNEDIAEENPNYHSHKYDRWGNFKPYNNISDSVCQSLDLPYVAQFDAANSNFKSDLDRNMAVWNLKSITLPSGASIDVKYESDDYAYVQNKTAMQLFKIAGLGNGTGNTQIDHNNRKVYFQLEKPILDSPTAKSEVQSYIDLSNKLFFKVYVNLKDNLYEYVNGYADVVDYNIDLTSKDGSGYCSRAYVELGKMKIGGKSFNYHPFSMAAWQHLRTSQPDIMALSGYKESDGNEKAKINGLMSIMNDLRIMFKGFYKNANNKNWGKSIDLSKSFIRLNSPDKVKYGGGLRVKEITIKDNWSDKTSGGFYGQVYDYTIQEGSQTISSGVATYEPLIGGEEIALRNAKGFSEEIALQTPNNLYFEYPVNENYYPGPGVGYRKITVKSLATHYASKTGTNDPYNIPTSSRTTGQTVHEFYTAKEFPVIADETEISKKTHNLFIPIPFLGQITQNKLTVSQGYSIELNDMHGKLKKVSNYAQDANGVMIPEPSSWISYNYQCTPVYSSSDRQLNYYVLNNKVNTLLSDRDGVATKSVRYVGMDYDFFTDMRNSRTYSTVGGINYNTDVITFGPFPIPVAVIWPNIGSSTTQTRTAVTNKIIHKSGILISMEAYDGGSLVRTDNRLFDALTGQPVLTTVTNNFDDPVYNYNLPSHLVYDGIGPAYKNIGLKFSGNLTAGTATNYYSLDTTANPANTIPWKYLVQGDEFIVNKTGSNPEGRKAIYIGLEGSKLSFYIEGTSYTGQKDFILTRSGRRNHLNSMAQNITGLSDPTTGRTTSICSTTIKIPKVTQGQWTITGISSCSYRQISLINAYLPVNHPSIYRSDNISGSPLLSQFLPLCTDDRGVTFDYIQNAGSGKICFSTSAGCTGTTANTSFYDANGNYIDFVNVDSLRNLQYESVQPIGTISQPYFQHLSVDVVYKVGSVTKAYIFDTKGWDLIGGPADSIYLVDSTITTSIYRLNNVLSASTKRFSDNWSLDNANLRGNYWTPLNRDKFANKNSYAKGSEGIWRESDTYTYVDYRKQSTNVAPKTDGTFDNVALFNFSNPSVSDCSVNNWRIVNAVTDYSINSAESENKDIQGIYSSALYGYAGGDLVTAIADNARNTEIAFESFEEFTAGQPLTLSNYGTGNFFLQTESPTSTIYAANSYTILSGNGTAIQTDRPFIATNKAIFAEVDGVVYYPFSKSGTKIKGSFNVVLDQAEAGNSFNSLLKLDPAQFTFGNVKWKGKVKIRTVTSLNVPKANFIGIIDGVSSEMAHTGKNSFKLTGIAECEQKRMNFTPGQIYNFSSWVANNTNYNSYGPMQGFEGINVKVTFKDAGGTTINSVTLSPSGNIINKWQKLEGIFQVPVTASSVLIQLSSGSSSGNYYSEAYFDDIRIHPTNSSFKTYVYNPVDYKLRAILDDNNYATLYYYDGSGNLFLIKKETERGIHTLQETLGHSKEN